MALIEQGMIEFSYSDYVKGKAISYGISILTMGIGAIASSTRVLQKCVDICRNLADKLRRATRFKTICSWLAKSLDKLANKI